MDRRVVRFEKALSFFEFIAHKFNTDKSVRVVLEHDERQDKIVAKFCKKAR